MKVNETQNPSSVTSESPRPALETSHTPTPWTYRQMLVRKGETGGFVVNSAVAIDKGFGEDSGVHVRVCDLSNASSNALTQEANAAFIVRCVNIHKALVEALKDAKAELEFWHSRYPKANGNLNIETADTALKLAGE